MNTQRKNYKSISSTPFLQLIHNKHSASIFKGVVVEAAGIHSDEQNKAQQLWAREAKKQ